MMRFYEDGKKWKKSVKENHSCVTTMGKNENENAKKL